MKLAETLQQKLSEWQPGDAGRHSWVDSSAETGWTIQVVADRVETLGCQVWELSLNAKDRLWPTGEALRSAAEGIAHRVSGLREPLRLIEVDSLRMEAILRSDKPSSRSDKLGYYEMHLAAAGTQIVLRRFETSPGLSNKREQAGFALTHEVIANLIASVMGR